MRSPAPRRQRSGTTEHFISQRDERGLVVLAQLLPCSPNWNHKRSIREEPQAAGESVPTFFANILVISILTRG